MNKQKPVKQKLDSPLKIKEIFYSIQGEGPFVGHPAIFIRVADCSIQCDWCDTDYAGGDIMTEAEILAEIGRYKGKLVVITGGEPFLYDLSKLIRLLDLNGYRIQIETNGLLSCPDFPWELVTVVCSPKVGKIHSDIVYHAEYFKYVVEGIAGIPVLSTYGKNNKQPMYPPPDDTQVYLMPRDGKSITQQTRNNEAAIKMVKASGTAIYSPRLHKDLNLR